MIKRRGSVSNQLNPESEEYPWMTSIEVNKMNEYLKNKWLDQDQNAKSQLYQVALNKKKQEEANKQKLVSKNNIVYQKETTKDPREKAMLDIWLKKQNIIDSLWEVAKSKWLDPSLLDDENTQKQFLELLSKQYPDFTSKVEAYITKNDQSVLDYIKNDFKEVEPWFLEKLKSWVTGTLESMSKFWEWVWWLLDKLWQWKTVTEVSWYEFAPMFSQQTWMTPFEYKQKYWQDKYDEMKQNVTAGIEWMRQWWQIPTTNISQDVLNIWEWALTIAWTSAAPWLTAWMTVAWATKPWEAILKPIWEAFGSLWWLITEIPWLKQYRDTLPPEDQERFDNLVGNTAGALLLGTKGKKNIIKDPKQFVLDNIGSKQIIDNFKQNVIGISKWVWTVTKPVSKFAWNVSEFVANQVTWLKPETRKFAIENPDLMTSLQKWDITPETKAMDIQTRFDEMMSEKGKLWQEYSKLRESWQTANTTTIDQQIAPKLAKEKINITNWWLEFDKFSKFNPKQQTAIQQARWLVNDIKQAGDIWVDDLLNIRQKMDDLINWEGKSTKSSAVDKSAENIIKSFRQEIDNVAKRDIPWLKELDSQFGEQINEISWIKKDWFDKQWNLKENALSKIQNLTSNANKARLQRLEQIMPWITKEIQGLQAVMDIKNAMENKVWTYVRWSMLWGGGIAAMMNPALVVPAIAWFVLTNPKVVIWILKWYGKLKNALWITKKIESGIKLTPEETMQVWEVIQETKPEVMQQILPNKQ